MNNKTAEQRAEEFISDLENRGYLNFDSGEQIERESIKLQLINLLKEYRSEL